LPCLLAAARNDGRRTFGDSRIEVKYSGDAKSEVTNRDVIPHSRSDDESMGENSGSIAKNAILQRSNKRKLQLSAPERLMPITQLERSTYSAVLVIPRGRSVT